MKIKRFNEKLNDGELEVGDYAICKSTTNSLFENMIGKITEIILNGEYSYAVVEYDLYKETTDFSTAFYLPQILYFSKNKEDLEIKLKSNKFNI